MRTPDETPWKVFRSRQREYGEDFGELRQGIRGLWLTPRGSVRLSRWGAIQKPLVSRFLGANSVSIACQPLSGLAIPRPDYLRNPRLGWYFWDSNEAMPG